MSDQTSIVDELQRFSPKIAAAGNLPSLVSVERIARDTRFRPSTLYIGYQSEVQERISRIQQAALYLIEDMPQFSLPYEHSNEVVFFPAQTDPAELMEECRGAMARLASLASKSLTLLDCMCRTDDLRRMADTAAQLIQNPFIVLDISYKVLGYSENYRVEDYQWQQNIKRGYCSFEYIGGFNRIDGVRAAPDSNEPFIVECFTSPLRRYITKLYLDGRQLGYAIAIEAVTPFSQTDPQLLVLISNFLARAIDNHHKLAQNVNNRMYDSVLIDCLEGNFKSRSAFQERISQTGIRMDSVYRLLLVNIGSYNNFDPGTEHLRQLINRLFGRSWIVCYNNSIVVLVDVQKRDFDILAVLKTERGTFGRYQLRVGVSDAFSDLFEITAHYQKALSALHITKKLAPDECISLYDDYKFYDMVIAAGKSCDPREFLHSAVLRMIRYDEKNKTEYFKTLHAYLRNGRHLEDTAEALFIHKNTVSYRVNKIRELFGVDLDDADTELNLYFSCKLVELSEYQMI